MKLLNHLLFSVWAIERSAAMANFPLLMNMLQGRTIVRNENAKDIVEFMNSSTQVIDADGWRMNDKLQNECVAVVNLTDPIYKYSMMCGPVGMIETARTLKQLDNHPNVKGIVLVLDTPGGEGSAARLLFETISSLNKVCVAYVDDLCASAGMYIASACDAIIANSSLARVGSIGTYVTIADFAKAFEMDGVEFLDIYADDSTEKNQDYLQAIEFMRSGGKKGSLDPVKKIVNKFNDAFLADVKEARGDSMTGDDWKTGKMFFADEALKIGLIDGIDTLDNVIQKFFK
jgi:ClpP class serine protease